ncbi:hypothetical protein BDR07DRAFT_1480389 [Suillus spraguei]|nr:hypothetical protein BDR07DRAFT_1480389 [Suillus spraguei]
MTLLAKLADLGPAFGDAYFGHKLRGTKGATMHNRRDEDEQRLAMEDLFEHLDVDNLQADQWHIDVGLTINDEDAPTIPILYDNGAYFICDIVLNSNPTFLRLPVQRTFDAESLICIYHAMSMDDIRSSFVWNAAPLSRRLPNPERTTKRKRKTRDVDDVRDPDRPRLRLDKEVRGIQFKRAVRLAGRDVDLHLLNGGDERDLDRAGNDKQGQLIVDNCIAKILEQFFLDIVEEVPNPKSAREGSYLGIPACMRSELARPELLQTADLPFTKAQYCICSDD